MLDTCKKIEDVATIGSGILCPNCGAEMWTTDDDEGGDVAPGSVRLCFECYYKELPGD